MAGATTSRPALPARLRPQDLGLGWLFVHAPDASVVVDVGASDAGQIVLWNRAASALFGIGESDALGRSLESLFVPWVRPRYQEEIAVCRTVAAGSETPLPAPIGLVVGQPDGGEVEVEVAFAPIQPAAPHVGPGPFVLVFISNVAERKRLEAQLLSPADASAQKTDLAAAQLDVLRLAARDIVDRVGNALVTPAAVLDVLAKDPLAPEPRRLLPQSADKLRWAIEYLRQLERVQRITTRETPIGPALDLERSSEAAS